MTRVVRPGGRVAIVDKYVLEGDDVEAMDHIERLRDPSHTNTLREVELRGLLTDAGLRLLAEERRDRPRSFDLWMHVAGRRPARRFTLKFAVCWKLPCDRCDRVPSTI